MFEQSIALASLTATYTDSENEDGLEEDSQDVKKTTPSDVQIQSGAIPWIVHPDSESPKSFSKISANYGSISVSSESSVKVQRLLVSYHDDTVISDDEGGEPVTSLDVPQPMENGATAPAIQSIPVTESPQQSTLVSDDEEADAYGVKIPPQPPGQCPQELQDKITKLYQRMQSDNLDMNKVIQERKAFRNPSIYEKLIQFCDINEFGTNYPPDRFNPFKFGKDSFYEELAKVQIAEMDKLEKARKEKTKCEIVSGTVKRSNSTNPNEDDVKKRKSKWDQVPSGAVNQVKPPVLLGRPTLTTLTASATGTKATVISAFGSMKKRL